MSLTNFQEKHRQLPLPAQAGEGRGEVLAALFNWVQRHAAGRDAVTLPGPQAHATGLMELL
jgi:hypothetical protein